MSVRATSSIARCGTGRSQSNHSLRFIVSPDCPQLVDGFWMRPRIAAMRQRERSVSRIDPHNLGLREILDRHIAVLAAKAGIPRAAPRQPDVGGSKGIHPDRAGLESPSESVNARDVAAPHAGGQTIYRAIGDSESILVVLEWDDRRDRPEDLLLRDAHLMRYAAEHGRADKVTQLAAAGASGHDLRTFTAADFDVIKHALHLDFGD